jgi:hypothetical protein
LISNEEVMTIKVDGTYETQLFLLNQFQLSFDFYFRWITWFPKFILFMHMHMQDHDNMSVLYVPHQKKAFAKYR